MFVCAWEVMNVALGLGPAVYLLFHGLYFQVAQAKHKFAKTYTLIWLHQYVH